MKAPLPFKGRGRGEVLYYMGFTDDLFSVRRGRREVLYYMGFTDDLFYVRRGRGKVIHNLFHVRNQTKFYYIC